MSSGGSDPLALIAEASRRLRAAGVPSPRHDAELLLAHACGRDRAALLAGRQPVSAPERERFRRLVERRAAREPLQHILGRWPFLDLDLKVDGRALVPRPETEDLALAVLARLPEDRPLLVADVGTGGGCLALAIASARPLARVVAVDLEPAALALAAENAAACGLAGRVRFVRADLLAPVAPAGAFDLVVSNPPYVAPEELPHLDPEVRRHEPRSALVAGRGGLAVIDRLVSQAPARLAPGGLLALEIAPAQARAALGRLRAAGLADAAVLPDRFGRPRVALARRPEA
ncbi:MAG: peptide chain release factor N(5)-glutamine methyltransferase [Acidobacteria bacterium]|nr:MAG: peptide chain release factor N(5)-glutamine methyltransferase [Acidobacteriota bacterium]